MQGAPTPTAEEGYLGKPSTLLRSQSYAASDPTKDPLFILSYQASQGEKKKKKERSFRKRQCNDIIENKQVKCMFSHSS